MLGGMLGVAEVAVVFSVDIYGMKVESILHELDGKRVDGTEHERTLKLLKGLAVPFYVVFQHVATSENDSEQSPHCYPSQEMILDAMTAIGQEEADLIFGFARNVEQSLSKSTIAPVDIVRLVIAYHGTTGT